MPLSLAIQAPIQSSAAAEPASVTRHRRSTRRRAGIVVRLLLIGLALAIGLAVPLSYLNVAAQQQPAGNQAVAAVSAAPAHDGLRGVIVDLAVDARPEGELSPSQVVEQRARVANARAQFLRSLDGTRYANVRSDDGVGFVTLAVSPAALKALESSRAVRGIRLDRAHDAPAPTGTSSNSNNPAWWHLDHMDLTSALNNGYDGRGQTVAILDTGVQSNHPYLTGKVVAEACYSSTTPGSATGNCPNGTYHQSGAGSARPCSYHASKCKHGTNVAGIAAGKYGVARAAKIIAVQVFHREAGTGVPKAYDSDILWGMKYVYDLRTTYRIAAVNISIGGGKFTGYCDNTSSTSSYYAWIKVLRAAKIATVISTGNDDYRNGVGSPACNSNAITVGNTTLDTAGRDAVYGNVSDGSNTWKYLDLLAPGTSICNAVGTNGVECWTGTSQAAPQVTGAFALLKQLEPTATVTAALTALQASGVNLTDTRSNMYTPRIQIWHALIYLYNH